MVMRSALQPRAVWPISCREIVSTKPFCPKDCSLTAAIATFRNLTIVRKARILEPGQVLLRVRWPAFFEVGTLRFRAEVESDDILAIELSL